MFKVQFENQTYYVRFQHGIPEKQTKKSRFVTDCRITRAEVVPAPATDGILQVFVEVGKGFARTHPNDAFDRSEGRKLSLTRALVAASRTLVAHVSEIAQKFEAVDMKVWEKEQDRCREFRTAIWTGYWNSLKRSAAVAKSV